VKTRASSVASTQTKASPRPRRTHATRIAELETIVHDLKGKLAQKEDEIIRVLLAAEDNKTVEARVLQKLEKYEQEHRAMKSVVEEVMGAIRQVEGKDVEKRNVGLATEPVVFGP
jgi:chromosome segregation ATPase